MAPLSDQIDKLIQARNPQQAEDDGLKTVESIDDIRQSFIEQKKSIKVEQAKKTSVPYSPSYLVSKGEPAFLTGAPFIGPGIFRKNADELAPDQLMHDPNKSAISRYGGIVGNAIAWNKEERKNSVGEWLKTNAWQSPVKFPLKIAGFFLHDIPASYIEPFRRDLNLDKTKLSGSDINRAVAKNMLPVPTAAVNIAESSAKLAYDIIKQTMIVTGVWDTVRDVKDGKVVYVEKMTPKELTEAGYKGSNLKGRVIFKFPEFKEFEDSWNKDWVTSLAMASPMIKYSLSKARSLRPDLTPEQVAEANALSNKALEEAQNLRKAGESPEKIKVDAVKRATKSGKEMKKPKKKTPRMSNSDRIYKEFRDKLEKATTQEEIDALKKEYVDKIPKELYDVNDAVKTLQDDIVNTKKTSKTKKGKKAKEEVKPAEPLPAPEEIPSEQILTKEGKPTEVPVKEEPVVARALDRESSAELATPDYEVLYDGEMEGLGHQLTLKPRGMSDKEIMESGRASTIYAKDFAEAQVKIENKIAEYNKAQDVKDAHLDHDAGIKPNVKGRKRLDEIFLQDEILTHERTEVLKQFEKEIAEDPYLYAQSLINETNRWYHKHEGANIELARRKLSELASRVDELKDEFPDIELFEDFKAMTRDAAAWARKVKKQKDYSETARKVIKDDKIEGYGTVADIQFYSGLPLDKIMNSLKSLYGDKAVSDVYTIGENLRDRINKLSKESKYSESEKNYLQSFAKDIDNSITGKTGFNNILDINIDINKLPSDLIDPLVRRIKNELDIVGEADTSHITNKMSLKEKHTIIKEFMDANSNDVNYIQEIFRDLIESTQVVKALENKGTKLYSGIPLDEMANVAKKYFDKVDLLKQGKNEVKTRDKINSFLAKARVKFLSQSANLKDALIAEHGVTGYSVVQSMILAMGATSRSSHILKQHDREVYGGLTQKEKVALDRVIFARRTRQIAENNPKAKNPFSAEEAQAYIDNLAKAEGLSPEITAELYRRTDAYFDIAKDQLKQLHEEGLISEKQYEELKNFDYQRRQMVDIIDPEFSYGLGGQKINVRESGVQKLAVGREKQLLETDSRMLLSELVVRTQNRIMANKAGVDLYNIAANNNKSPIVRIKNKETKIPKGWSPINVFIGGERKNMYMPNFYAKEWVTKNREITYELGKFARIVSGSSILRSMATGVNVGFAIKNMFRDFAYMWVASSHYTKDGGWTSTYSSFAPKAAGQMFSDIRTVAPDVIFRKGIYNEIAEQGVLLDFLSNKDRIMRERIGKGNEKYEAIIDALHYASTTSELLGRAALYNRARRKGLSQKEAAFLAKDYLHFGDYGTFTKAVDTVVPYFGATVKATEGIWRAGKRNPQEFAMKATQVMMLGATIHMLNQSVNPEAYKQVSSEDKKRYFILPLYIPYTDSNGQERFFYPRIPKDSAQAFFATLGEYGIDKVRGIESDPGQVVNTLKNLSPVQEIPSIPMMDAIKGYVYNKDFWSGNDIWYGPQVGKGMFDLENEYKESGPNPTNPALVAAGKATGLSPERLKYSIESVFTKGNIYTEAFASVSKELFDQLPENEREMVIGEMLSRGSVTKGLFGSTNASNEYRDVIEDIEVESNIKRVVNNRTLDRLTEEVFLHKSSEPEKIKDFLRTIPEKEERERLFNRVKFGKEIVGLPNKNLWRKLYDLTPEAAAEAMHKVMETKSLEEKHKLIQEFKKANNAQNILTDRFKKRYAQLKGTGGD